MMKKQGDNVGWAASRAAGCFFLGALPASLLALMAQLFSMGALSRLKSDETTLGAEIINLGAPLFAVAGAMGLWIAVFTKPQTRSWLHTCVSVLIVAGLVADAPFVVAIVVGTARDLPSFAELPKFALLYALYLGPFAFGLQYLVAQLSARVQAMRSSAAREMRAH